MVTAGALAFLTMAGLVVGVGTANADSGADLYVDQYVGCDDSTTNSSGIPFCTIQAAADLAQPGQTVVVAWGGMGNNLLAVSFAPGQTISNLVIVPLYNSTTKLKFTSDDPGGSFDVTADMQGYFQNPAQVDLYPMAATSSAFTVTNPTRILDTRNGTGDVPAHPVGPNSDLALQVAGVDGVPADVSAVAINITDVNPTTTGYLTISDAPGAGPTSNLHFSQGENLSEQVIVPVSSDGKIYLHNYTGSTDLVAGLAGYFQP
jgi:hypothetical protein